MLEDVRPGCAPSDRTSDNGGPQAHASTVLEHDTLDASVFQSTSPSALTLPSLLLALALHIGIGTAIAAGWIEWTDPRALAGASGANLDAISVEVEIRPSIAVARSEPNAAAEEATAASADQTDGAKPVQPAETTPEMEEKTKPVDTAIREQWTETPPETLPKPEPKPRQEPALIATRDDQPPHDAEAPALPRLDHLEPRQPQTEPPDRQPTPVTKSEDVKSSPPSIPPGGVISQGSDQASRPKQSRAAASAGEIRAFARSLAEALAKTRPPSGSAKTKGTVNVEFIVGEGGGAEVTRVARSSGSRSLDELAIEAVRRARLPQPPAGITIAQRTFVIPYHFR